MEDNQEKNLDNASDFSEDFADFSEEEIQTPAIDEDLIEEEEKQKESEPRKEIEETPKQEEIQEIKEVQEEKITSPWDNLEEENLAVKKYIFYVSKDFVPLMDDLTTDERSAYINDAIQKKIDIESEEKRANKKRKMITHSVIMLISFILFSPIALWVAHKAIIATFDNYKYSQENFEKLYKSRFEKDRAYMRSIQYNKEQEAKNKKH